MEAVQNETPIERKKRLKSEYNKRYKEKKKEEKEEKQKEKPKKKPEKKEVLFEDAVDEIMKKNKYYEEEEDDDDDDDYSLDNYINRIVDMKVKEISQGRTTKHKIMTIVSLVFMLLCLNNQMIFNLFRGILGQFMTKKVTNSPQPQPEPEQEKEEEEKKKISSPESLREQGDELEKLEIDSAE
jgi:hypothetical protein